MSLDALRRKNEQSQKSAGRKTGTPAPTTTTTGRWTHDDHNSHCHS
ncbi:hypothetical protein [Streptomyces hebeiensis]